MREIGQLLTLEHGRASNIDIVLSVVARLDLGAQRVREKEVRKTILYITLPYLIGLDRTLPLDVSDVDRFLTMILISG